MREKVVLLPHIGSATDEARQAMADLAARNVLAGVGVWKENDGLMSADLSL